jgi:pyruvate, orthophosphate dikinase
MPGILKSVVNIGATRPPPSKIQSDERRFLLDCQRRFLASYGHVVLGIDKDQFDRRWVSKEGGPQEGQALETELLEKLTVEYTDIVDRWGGIPSDLEQQIHDAITAVCLSWSASEAFFPREPTSYHTGTAVNIQVMVFGNRDERSGAGVAYSRDPVTGRRQVAGDYVLQGQGEDVAGGSTEVVRLANLFRSQKIFEDSDTTQARAKQARTRSLPRYV